MVPDPDVVPDEASLPGDTDTKLLLEADQLIYDFDAQTVTAIGNVQIYYDGYTLDAEKVVYDERSGH